jgi:hypothetical protein
VDTLQHFLQSNAAPALSYTAPVFVLFFKLLGYLPSPGHPSVNTTLPYFGKCRYKEKPLQITSPHKILQINLLTLLSITPP